MARRKSNSTHSMTKKSNERNSKKQKENKDQDVLEKVRDIWE